MLLAALPAGAQSPAQKKNAADSAAATTVNAAPARAAKRGPIRLYPTRQDSASDDDPGAGEEAGEETAKLSESEVKIDNLGKVDPSSLGTLGAGAGGFPPDMWRGSRRELVQALLPQLPVATPSRAARQLLRRLLLTAAEAPEGDDSGPSLLALRAEKLAEAGFLDEVNELISLAPFEHRDAMLARVQMEALLLGGDHASACRIADRMARENEDAFWLKSSGFCLVLRQDLSQVELIEQLLRDAGEDDPVYFHLLGVLAKTQVADARTLPKPEPLHLAMLRASSQPIPEDAAMNARPAVLRHMLRAANVSDLLRLDAAIRAERVGALSSDELRRLLGTFPFSAETRADPDRLIQQVGGPRAWAMFFQILRDEPDQIGIARTLERAWKFGRENQATVAFYRIYSRFLNGLNPTPELVFIAPAAVRAYLAAGERLRAKRWYDLLLGLREQEHQLAARRLAPLMMIAGALDAGGDQSGRLTEWWWGEAAHGDDERYRQAAFLYSLSDALGFETPEAVWRELIVSPHHTSRVEASAALRHQLHAAAAAGRVGETVLLSLLTLGENEPERLGPVTLVAAVAALQSIGQQSEARALALEILLRMNY